MTSTATPRFSVFTPSHRPRFLDECLATLQAQTCPDWEWIVLLNNGARWRPEHPDERIRVEIADVVPMYRGIESLRDTGDQVQWGGERLCDGWDFPTPDGKAHFAVVEPPERRIPEGHLLLSTRRGKQFNSMVFRDRDPLTGAHRDALFISADDAGRIGVTEGDPLLVRSACGEVRARATEGA